MLSIRMQRLGRKGHPSYRVVVQDSRLSPKSGKYVALLGSYDPHTKNTALVRDKAEFYLSHGAQPSDRVAKLFKSEKIKLPKWVREPTEQKRDIKNPDKLRRNRPPEAEAVAEKPTEPEAAPETSTEETETITSESKPEANEEKPPEEAPRQKSNQEPIADKSAEEKSEPEAESKEEKSS